MEQCARADHVLLAGQGDAALADKLFELPDGLEIGVDQRFVYELPKVFGGLQLGAMRRLIHEPDAFRDSQVFRPVPSGVIKLQNDALGVARTCGFREIHQDRLEHLFANCVRDVPHRGPGGRLDEAPDVKPFVAVMSNRDRALAFGRPDPAQDGLQADAMLIHRPGLDGGIRILLFLFSGSVLQFFLVQHAPPRLRLWDGAAAGVGWNIRWQ